MTSPINSSNAEIYDPQYNSEVKLQANDNL